MPNYVVLIDYTERGIKAIGESPERADQFIKKAELHGINVKDLYWTMGAHDGVLIVEAPDDATMASVFLALAKAGNVRTTTMRAYGRTEFESIVKNL